MSSEENLSRYPHAMALKSALRSYSIAREQITPELQPLVMPQIKSIRESISEVFGVSNIKSNKSLSSRRVRWDGKEIIEWIAGLTELVSRFEERVETLLQACHSIDLQLKRLSHTEYNHESFLSAAQKIQKTVDELSLAGYSELSDWVTHIDDKMGKVLGQRLESAILSWCTAFNADNKKVTVEIVLRNQTICTQPSLPVVRSLCLKKFHEYVSVVCSLPTPCTGRFEVFESNSINDKNTNGTFDRLMKVISPEIVSNAYDCIEYHMDKISDFVSQWLGYQALWDTRVDDVSNLVGNNMSTWQSLLDEAVVARNALDISKTTSVFGPVVVKYDKVHSQINLKYDSWQKELQSCYADVLGQKIQDLHQNVCEAKSKLESISLDSTTATFSIVLNVTYIQEMKGHLEPWSIEISSLLNAERILKQQRHLFRSDWLEGSRLLGQFQHMEHVLSKRVRLMEEQMPLLQTRVIAEDKVAEKRSMELLAHWDSDKPLRGNITPFNAKEILSNFEFHLKKALSDDENLVKAKIALGLETKARDNKISSHLDELQDLKEVWEAISSSYESFDEIKKTLWITAAPRKIRKQLEDITTGKLSSVFFVCDNTLKMC